MNMYKINLNFKNANNTVLIDDNFFEIMKILSDQPFCEKAASVAIITDKLVFNLYKSIIKKEFSKICSKIFIFKIRSGEQAKNFKNFNKICNFLAKNKIKRNDLIIAFGGGVVCDLTTFVASCYLRGVKLILVPTTLLAMVDACVGGKAAINLKYGKNLVGCFKHADFVLCNLNFTSTLKEKEFQSAFAEIIKYSAMFSESFFNFLMNCSLKFSINELKFIVLKCLQLKKKIVELDEFDTLNKRVKLNFGHTIGHALEKLYNYGSISHGQAVAVGMAFCVKQSEKLGLTEKGEFDKIKFILKKFNLFYNFKINSKKLLRTCLNDKKTLNDGIYLVLLKKIGVGYVKKFSLDDFKKFLNA